MFQRTRNIRYERTRRNEPSRRRDSKEIHFDGLEGEGLEHAQRVVRAIEKGIRYWNDEEFCLWRNVLIERMLKEDEEMVAGFLSKGGRI